MDLRLKKAVLLSLVLSSFLATSAHAFRKTGEISLTGGYTRTDYGANSYSRSKRYTFSVGYNLSILTEVEVAFTSSEQYYQNGDIQTMTVESQSLSGSLVQTLVPPDWYFQPYAKGGAAQLNRKQRGTISGIPTREVYIKSPSFVLGAGARIFFLQTMSFKLEYTMLFPNFKWEEGKNNQALEGGISYTF